MDPATLLSRLRASRIPHREIAEAIGRDRVVATNLLLGKRGLKADEIAPLERLLEAHGAIEAGQSVEAGRYVAVEVLPACCPKRSKS